MNPRRVHRLMLERFPVVDAVSQDWINAGDRNGARREVISEVLDRWFDAPQLLVHVHRKLGGHMPRDAALDFICAHIGQGWGGYLRVTDRAFSAFVVVATNGVATGWRAPLPAVRAKGTYAASPSA